MKTIKPCIFMQIKQVRIR